MSDRTQAIRLGASAGVVLSGGLWGAFWMPVREVEQAGIGGGWINVAIFVPIALVLLPFVLGNTRGLLRGRRTLVPAGLLTGAAFALYATGLLLSDVVRVILLFYLTPVWGTLLARVVLGEPITRERALALACGLAGLVIILGVDGTPAIPRNAGDWMGLLAGITWAWGTLYAYKGGDDRPVDMLFVFCLAGAVLGACMVALPIEGNSAGISVGVLRDAAGWLLVTSFVFTLPTMLLILWAAKRLDPGRVGLLLMAEVLVGVVTAALWSGEVFGLREAVGALLIGGAGLIEVLPRRSRGPQRAPS